MKTNIKAVMWECKSGVTKSLPNTFTVLYKSGMKRKYEANFIIDLPEQVYKFVMASIKKDSYQIAKVEVVTKYTVKTTIIFKGVE